MKKRGKLTAVLLTLTMVLGAATAAYALETENGAPVAENLELCTYRGVSVGGRFAAVDPEGEALSYEIVTEPGKGTVEVSENGRFVYTPAEEKKGKDYFGYKAVDASGNSSEEATVIITIMKQKSKVTYSDLQGDGAEFAAMYLTENGIYTGSLVGGEYVFDADEPITRGEFLAMCMECSGRDILSAVSRTGFADDAAIPGWLKPYVSTAVMCGAVKGYASEGANVFEPDKPVSFYEAAVMLSSAAGMEDVANTAGEAVPTWAGQAVSNLTAYDIVQSLSVNDPGALTRGEAAMLLAAAAMHLNEE